MGIAFPANSAQKLGRDPQIGSNKVLGDLSCHFRIGPYKIEVSVFRIVDVVEDYSSLYSTKIAFQNNTEKSFKLGHLLQHPLEGVIVDLQQLGFFQCLNSI